MRLRKSKREAVGIAQLTRRYSSAATQERGTSELARPGIPVIFLIACNSSERRRLALMQEREQKQWVERAHCISEVKQTAGYVAAIWPQLFNCGRLRRILYTNIGSKASSATSKRMRSIVRCIHVVTNFHDDTPNVFEAIKKHSQLFFRIVYTWPTVTCFNLQIHLIVNTELLPMCFRKLCE